FSNSNYIGKIDREGIPDSNFNDWGAKFDGPVRALAYSQGTLFASGDFNSYEDNGGLVAADRFMVLDAVSGTHLAEVAAAAGLNQAASRMAAVPGGGVYAVGSFRTFNGQPAGNIL